MHVRVDVPDDAKQKLLLSAETMEGLRITGTYAIIHHGIVFIYNYYSTLLCGHGSVSAVKR